MQEYENLKKLVEEAGEDIAKAEGGNKAASTRARKKMQESRPLPSRSALRSSKDAKKLNPQKAVSNNALKAGIRSQSRGSAKLRLSSFSQPHNRNRALAPAFVIDLSKVDFNARIHGKDDIREANPHRFEFEMLDGIVWVDPAAHELVGVREIRADEFWCADTFPADPCSPAC